MATPQANRNRPSRLDDTEHNESFDESDLESEQEEEFNDLIITQWNGAWDFPLSRQEKMQRLLQLYQAELEANGAPSSEHISEGEEEEFQADAFATEDASATEDFNQPLRREVPVASISLLSSPGRSPSGRGRRIYNDHIAASSSSSSSAATLPISRRLDAGAELLSRPWIPLPLMRPPSSQSNTEVRPQLPNGVFCSHGSTAGIVWNGGAVVNWLQFLSHGQERAQSSYSEALMLDDGEHIRAVRGRAATMDGRLADWIVLVTSSLRCITLGRPSKGSPPTFSFLAAPGHEITGIFAGRSGAVGGVEQRPFATERDAAVPAASYSQVSTLSKPDGPSQCNTGVANRLAGGTTTAAAVAAGHSQCKTGMSQQVSRASSYRSKQLHALLARGEKARMQLAANEASQSVASVATPSRRSGSFGGHPTSLR
eukprot:TRINITY_DN32164_c0_g1_i1.p1 TRINITY_DN32164_c0_g1~~TRINITY_DN32164_c0_g1_i1.p1  ORF type:complete len:428 (+),score=80.14 TRINITY_DN32164_c0_g1_i1:99-1382(+)